jgi:hypothetical protein
LKALREAGLTELPDRYGQGMDLENPRLLLGELTEPHLDSILSVLDRWVSDVRSANHGKKEPVC